MMLPIFRRLTLAAVFACSLVLPQSLRAQCACGGGASAYAFDPGMAMPVDMGMGMAMGSPLPFTIEGNAIYVILNLPEMGEVEINGDPTISVGTTRYFVVRGLEAEKDYKFDIRVSTKNPAGVPMMEVQNVTLKTGAIETLTFKPVKRKADVLKALEKGDGEKKDPEKKEEDEEEKTEVVSNIRAQAR